jgi:hypothetical protein
MLRKTWALSWETHHELEKLLAPKSPINKGGKTKHVSTVFQKMKC